MAATALSLRFMSAQARQPASRWRWSIRALVVTILLATAALVFLELARQDREEARRDEQLAAATVTAMEGAVTGTLSTGATALAIVEADGRIEPDRFERFARKVIVRPGVVSVAWGEYVPAVALEQFEANLGMQVWESRLDGTPRKAGAREEYLPVVQAWPGEATTLVGFDLWSEAARAAAVSRARDLGQPSATSPIMLTTGSQRGLVVVVPLYYPRMPTTTIPERRRAFAGALVVGHDADAFLEYMVLQPGARLRVTDNGQLLTETELPLPDDDPGVEATAIVAGRNWTLSVRHPERASWENVWWIVGVGIAAAATAGWTLHRTERHVDELQGARDQLARQLFHIQRGSLRAPDEPPPGVEVAVRYLPAAEHARLGGDWYDVLAIDGRLVITVGDVSGHGIDAITHMQQVRQVIATFAFERHAPAEVFRLADEVLRSEPMASGAFATVWLGYLDVAELTLHYASAGHPPALLCAPEAEAVELDGVPGPPLNLPVRASEWNDQVVDVPPDALLFVYTDGVVESRTGGIDAGVPMARSLLDVDGSLDDLADSVMGARPDPGRDDAALILVRLRPTATGDGGAPVPAASRQRAPGEA